MPSSGSRVWRYLANIRKQRGESDTGRHRPINCDIPPFYCRVTRSPLTQCGDHKHSVPWAVWWHQLVNKIPVSSRGLETIKCEYFTTLLLIGQNKTEVAIKKSWLSRKANNCFNHCSKSGIAVTKTLPSLYFPRCYDAAWGEPRGGAMLHRGFY